MRDIFAEHLHATMLQNPRVFLVYGDIGNHLFDKIKIDFPLRFVNAGVAEANMVSVASGLSYGGAIPVCYTINSFLYLKALEQIKLDLAYPGRRVVLVGTGGGLSYGELGTSHHSVEDYSVLRSIPNLSLYSPGDEIELRCCLDGALAADNPSYLRIGKKEQSQIHPTSKELAKLPGPCRYAGTGDSEIAVISTGPIGVDIRTAVSSLSREIQIDAFSVPQLSPAPIEKLRTLLTDYRALLVVEEHYPHGGLFSIVLEAFAGELERPQIFRQGLPHRFFTGQGNQAEIRHGHKLSVTGLVEALREVAKS